MQEKRNKRLAILFLVLCCTTAVAYWFSKDRGVVDVDKNIFKDYDLGEIDEIVMESSNGKVALKFNGSTWKVNNQFDADPSMIEVLFATLQQAEPKRPLAPSIQDSVSNALKLHGIKISLLTSGTQASSFYAGGNPQKTQAFFCETNGETRSYLMTIPGYRVYVSGIFELPEKDWKNKYVFGFNWRNFQELESKFPHDPASNFKVALQDNSFAVQGLADPDTAKLNDFLDDVSLLMVDEYVDTSYFAGSPSKPLPLMTLAVKDIARRVYTLELYPPIQKDGSVPGLINNDQWALFDRNKVQNIVKKKSFFEK